MGTLVIENVDDVLMGDLASLASENRMQIEAQAHHILRQAVPVRDHRDLAERLDVIAAMTPKGVAQADSLDLLRQDRDR